VPARLLLLWEELKALARAWALLPAARAAGQLRVQLILLRALVCLVLFGAAQVALLAFFCMRAGASTLAGASRAWSFAGSASGGACGLGQLHLRGPALSGFVR